MRSLLISRRSPSSRSSPFWLSVIATCPLGSSGTHVHRLNGDHDNYRQLSFALDEPKPSDLLLWRERSPSVLDVRHLAEPLPVFPQCLHSVGWCRDFSSWLLVILVVLLPWEYGNVALFQSRLVTVIHRSILSHLIVQGHFTIVMKAIYSTLVSSNQEKFLPLKLDFIFVLGNLLSSNVRC